VKIYVAGPLFNSHERGYLEHIASILEADGYTTFVPHRDAGLLGNGSDLDRPRLFASDLAALRACDIVVALLTGADHDSGTSAELGIAFAEGKPCYGISDDFRWLNNMIWAFVGKGSISLKKLRIYCPS
jgi:nucleoside 2-deoxyribosyltransferase